MCNKRSFAGHFHKCLSWAFFRPGSVQQCISQSTSPFCREIALEATLQPGAVLLLIKHVIKSKVRLNVATDFRIRKSAQAVKSCLGEIVRLNKFGNQQDDCGQKLDHRDYQLDANFAHKGSRRKKARSRRATKKPLKERLEFVRT